MNEPKQHTWEWRAGYDYATEKYKAEIDRLRADAEYWQKANAVLCEQQDRLRAEIAEWRQAAKVEASERRKAHAEIDRLRAELADTKADMLRIHNEKVDRVEEVILLRAERDELIVMLISLRQELKGYEMAATGDSYNNKELNALLAKTAKEGE